MGRIMAIDYGTKRTGIAVTDPLKIIANGLDTIPTANLWTFLENYFQQEAVECVVFGEAKQRDGRPNKNHHLIVGMMRKIQKAFPLIKVVTFNERYTSMRAKEIILKSGAKRKKRREKGLVDKISAILILQDYMETYYT